MRFIRLLAAPLLAGCVYFNAMYDANREYDAGLESLQEQSRIVARVRFDSVIAKTGRIVEDHPDSKYADDAAILKVRAELHNEMWDSAVETSLLAERLAGSEESRATSLGLRGVALRELESNREADSLLTLALAQNVRAEDEALFLFQRGLARQWLGRPEQAAQDLEAAATSVELSPEGALTLSIALRDIAEYERSADLAARLLPAANPNPASPLYLHVDSLSALAPVVVDSMAAGLVELPAVQATRMAAFHYIAGRARLHGGREAEALDEFAAAMREAASSQAAAAAAYYTIELRLRAARRPEDVRALIPTFSSARRAGDSEMRARADVWERAAREFDGLNSAYESRGESAAEAILRAAELARIDLHSPALARGGYLLYLDLVPDSRWAAKAILGALSVSGYPPDPAWVDDRGEATDEDLRRHLLTLPEDDPYRMALGDDVVRGFMADSMYVLAEADLRRRLIEIRMLFDPTAGDTISEAEPPGGDPEEDEVQN